jgi:hypothetical protein
MPKPHTFPTLYDEALQISISKLKEWKYLNPNQIKSGTLNWSSNGNQRGSISIKINTKSKQTYIELDYKYRDKPRNYKVYLTSTASNLDKGKIWYFLCPHTNKRCRKLYSIGGYFLHREAFKKCMYQSQIETKRYRQIDKTFGAYFRSEELYSELHKKHFKKTYAGMPTKRYLRIIKQIEQAERIDYLDIELALMS